LGRARALACILATSSIGMSQQQYVDLLARLTAPNPLDVLNRIKVEKPPSYKPPRRMFITGGIKPVDLYCYLYARFGPPNGMQSFLRSNDSHNVFHWHYSLWAGDHGIDIMAGTYKIEVWYPEAFCYSDRPLEDFVAAIASDLAAYDKSINEIKAKLEKWLMFANPFHRLQLALEGMLSRAGELLETTKHPPKQPTTAEESKAFGKLFQPIANASYEAFGLCRSVRMLLPVVAETFVNFLIYVLCKPEIKADKRLYENVKRAPIDIRIKSLSHNCIGFARPINYDSEVCKRIHKIFSNRNNFLHGNITPEQDSHETVFFNGTVPLFTEWKNFYERCFAAQLKSKDYEAAIGEMADVSAFTEEVLGCLTSRVAAEMRRVLNGGELGFNPDTRRIGLLFPNVLMDYIVEFDQR